MDSRRPSRTRLWRTIAQTGVKWQENHLAFRTRKAQKKEECKLRQNNLRASGWQRFRHKTPQDSAIKNGKKNVVAMRRLRAESLQVKCVIWHNWILRCIASDWLIHTYKAPRNAFFWLPERCPRLQKKNWNVIPRVGVKLIFDSKTTNINSRLFVLAGKQSLTGDIWTLSVRLRLEVPIFPQG